MKISVLQQNHIVYSNSMQDTLLSKSSNGLGNKTVISCLFVVYTMDDLMHYCTQPLASYNSASGRPQHLTVIVLTILHTGMKYLYIVILACTLDKNENNNKLTK